MKAKVLNKEEIMQVIEMKPTIEAVERVYTLKCQGETVVWPTTFYVFEEGNSDMDIKSGYLPGGKKSLVIKLFLFSGAIKIKVCRHWWVS